MTLRNILTRIAAQEDINFLLTNRIPRRLATRFVGWFSQVRHPLVSRASIRLWRLFCDVDLTDAKAQNFASLHDCFVRELKDGARPVDPDPAILASPCDAIIGAGGRIEDDQVYQIKGMGYRLRNLIPEASHADLYRNGRYVTLRLTAGMYHHFHAPADLTVEQVTYISGDTWNVNPIALKRIERLFCRNERAPILTRLATGEPVTLVPVAAILVAGIRLPFAGELDLRPGGARSIPCSAAFRKGEPMGWFEHGSTILVFAPDGFELLPGAREGRTIRIGEPLLRRPALRP